VALTALASASALSACAAGSAPASAGAGSSATPALVPGQTLHSPLGCPAAIGVLVLQRLAVQLDHAYTVVVARCDSGAGSPPSGVFLVAGGGSDARVAQTLVQPGQELQVSALTIAADGIAVTATGYSSPQVPRCCPDRAVTLTWRRTGDSLVLVPQ
jgi:hypothetical protein